MTDTKALIRMARKTVELSGIRQSTIVDAKTRVSSLRGSLA